MKYRPVLATQSPVQPGDHTGQAGFVGWCLTSNLFVLAMAILLAVFLPQSLRALLAVPARLSDLVNPSITVAH